jgi:pre-mRNA 3'-end-processing factor FIP1
MIQHLKDATQAAKQLPIKGVDLEAQGTIGDVPTLDYDLQGIKDEDKPWRKPGADITDYFNYGFNEETWIAYCMKQRRLRAENSSNKVRNIL